MTASATTNKYFADFSAIDPDLNGNGAAQTTNPTGAYRFVLVGSGAQEILSLERADASSSSGTTDLRAITTFVRQHIADFPLNQGFVINQLNALVSQHNIEVYNRHYQTGCDETIQEISPIEIAGSRGINALHIMEPGTALSNIVNRIFTPWQLNKICGLYRANNLSAEQIQVIDAACKRTLQQDQAVVALYEVVRKEGFLDGLCPPLGSVSTGATLADQAMKARSWFSESKNAELIRSINQINLDEAKISCIPHEIEKFTELKHFFLKNNHITSWAGVNFPPKLTTLVLDNNPIDSLGRLPDSINFISLNNCRISQLPTLWPAELTALYLDYNPIGVSSFKDVTFPWTLSTLTLRETPLVREADSYLNQQIITNLRKKPPAGAKDENGQPVRQSSFQITM